MKKSLWIGIASLFLGLGCSAKPTTPAANADKPVVRNENEGQKMQALNPNQNCRRGVFSPDGRKVLAICENPPQHTSWQLYELDYGNKKQRRVTWQDGDISSADWVDDEIIAYSSSTDELKEIPFLPQKPAAGEIPGDIYRGDRFGDDIQRLSSRSGYDGDLSVHPKTKEIYFVARTPNEQEIMKVTSKSKPAVVIKFDKLERTSPVAVMDGTLAWLEKKVADGLWQMRTTNRKMPVRLKDRNLRSLRPTPDGHAWIAVEGVEPAGSKVWLIGLNENCEKPLHESKLRISFADAAANPPRLILTTVENEKQRVSVTEISATEEFQCPDQVKK